MRRYLLPFRAPLSAAVCASQIILQPIFATDKRPRPVIAVQTAADQILRLGLEEYTLGCVRAETYFPRASDQPAEAARTMLQVQALLCRTYAIANRGRHAASGFDLCATTHCQLFWATTSPVGRDERFERAARAVADTRGQLIVFEGTPIQALFHSSCGGATSSAHAVWDGPERKYLHSKRDRFCPSGSHADWRFEAPLVKLAAALNRDSRTNVGDVLKGIEVVRRDEAGRAREVRLTGSRSSVVRGEVLRSAVIAAFGPDSLRSTKFALERQGMNLIFEGAGFGHGVGLCQQGASQMARAGRSPARIIQHYYTGVRIRGGG